MKKILLLLFLSLSIVSYSQTSRPRYEDATVNGTDTYALTHGTVLPLNDGLTYSVIFTNAPTGASTLRVNGLAVKPLVDASGNALTSSSFTSGFTTDIRYDAGSDKWKLVAGTGGGGGGGGSVNSVVGTANRITSTGGTDPVINISATYDAALTTQINAKVADAINDGTTTIAPSQNAVFDALALKAPLASPTFTGVPSGPTPTSGTNTTQLATTAFTSQSFVNRSRLIVNPTGEAYNVVFPSDETGPTYYGRKIYNLGGTNEHGFIAGDNFANIGYAYASFDSQPIFTDAGSYDHLANFQSRGWLNASVTVGTYYSFLSAPSGASGSSIGTLYGFWMKDNLFGGTVSGPNYGVRVETLTKGAAIWGVYVDTNNSFNGGNILQGVGNTNPGGRSLSLSGSLPTFGMNQSNVEKFIIAIASGSNVGTPGSVSGDVVFRAVNQAMLFSADEGVTTHFGIGATGALKASSLAGTGNRIVTADASGNLGASLTLAESAYTPIPVNTTNVAASTAYVTGYYRIGNSVTVYGKIDIDATLAASTATELQIDLPIASNMTGEQDLAGTAVSDAVASLTARIKGDATSDKASFVFKALSLSNDSYSFEFSYKVK